MTVSFLASLDRFSLETLEQEKGSVYAIDSRLRIIYQNPAWFIFAAENGGEPAISSRFRLGCSLGDAIQGPLHEFYVRHYLAALHSKQSWKHDYECSSESEFRLYHQESFPIANHQALVIINSLKVYHPHLYDSAASAGADESSYRNEHGFITQCSHCRRVQRPENPEQWDWVAEWVSRIPPNTSHSLCRPCFDYYFRFRKIAEE